MAEGQEYRHRPWNLRAPGPQDWEDQPYRHPPRKRKQPQPFVDIYRLYDKWFRKWYNR